MKKHLQRSHGKLLLDAMTSFSDTHEVELEATVSVNKQALHLENRNKVEREARRRSDAAFVRMVVLNNLSLTLGDSEHVGALGMLNCESLKLCNIYRNGSNLTGGEFNGWAIVHSEFEHSSNPRSCTLAYLCLLPARTSLPTHRSNCSKPFPKTP